ncbi:hypothetical protein KR044_006620, partial [Drosophila immigrans]
QLTSKDFSCEKGDCFPFLRQVQPINYYSQVQEPLAALQTIAKLRHQTVVWDNETSLLETSCLPNEVHVYNFTDRQLNNHDSIMKAVSATLLDCPLVQLYTAHGEELEAQHRRQDRVTGKENRQELTRVVQPLISQNTHKATVLRHIAAVVSVDKITLAEEVRKGLSISYKRTEVTITEAPLRLTKADDANILTGFFVEMDTSLGPLAIDVLPAKGNWLIWRVRLNHNIFLPRDLLFYGRKFSFCCSELLVYSDVGSCLTLSMFYMDVESKRELSPLDLDYVAKRCWLCQHFLTPSITQVLFTLVLLVIILGVGLSMLLSIGRPKKFPPSSEPEVYVKGYA